MGDLPPSSVIASFDSATMLHAALLAALRGEPFAHLGHRTATALGVRAAGRLPWPLLRRVYTRIGASEGLDPARLGDVDLESVAGFLIETVPGRRYPAVMVGSSNGALTHLAAAAQVPWLPGTVLVPVARRGDPARPDQALAFGRRVAGPLLDRNQDIVLHHMHDHVQDELMVAQMTYFRVKWTSLPVAYQAFLDRSLAPGAPVVLVYDTSTWPVVRVDDRHVFQTGAQGGVTPDAYLRSSYAPVPDDESPEAEWGAEPAFAAAVADWCRTHAHPLVRLVFHGPQAPAHAVATVMRDWTRARGEAADRLVVPSFILGDPWTTLARGAVPFWTFFSVQPALESLARHLEDSEPYRSVEIMQFQHGVPSAGIASPADWLRVARRHAPRAQMLGVDAERFPHDIATLARYGPALNRLPGARHPWTPLSVDSLLMALAQHREIQVAADVSTPPR